MSYETFYGDMKICWRIDARSEKNTHNCIKCKIQSFFKLKLKHALKHDKMKSLHVLKYVIKYVTTSTIYVYIELTMDRFPCL